MARKTFATLAAFKTADAQAMAQPPNSSDPDITGTGPVVEVVVTELGPQVFYWCVGNTEPDDDETVLRQTFVQNGVTYKQSGGAWKTQEGSGAAIEAGSITSSKLAAVFGLGNNVGLATSATGAVVAGSDSRDRVKVALTITRAMLTGLAGGVKTKTVSASQACPAGARLLGYEVASVTGFDDAAHGSYSVEVGAASTNDVMGSVSVAAGQTGFPKAGSPGALGYPCAPIGGDTLSVVLTGSVDLNTATVGSVTVNVFYSVMP